MNVGKKFLIIAAALGCMFVLSGCIGTCFSKQVLNIGTTEYCADFSRIEERKVYEVNNEYFIKAPVLEYESSPYFWGRSLFFSIIELDVDFTKTGESKQPLWIKLDQHGKEYLCQKYSGWDYFLHIERFDGEIAENPPDLTSAKSIPALHCPSPKKGKRLFGEETMGKTADLGYSRDWTGYTAMPLLLITVPVDIVTNIVSTTALIIASPFIALLEDD